jgi:uncharacterized integral membrane protein
MEEPRPEQSRQIPWPRLAAAALVLAAVIWFAVDNSQRVTIDWWVTERQSRLIYVIIVSAVLGALIDRLIQRRRRRSKA